MDGGDDSVPGSVAQPAWGERIASVGQEIHSALTVSADLLQRLQCRHPVQ